MPHCSVMATAVYSSSSHGIDYTPQKGKRPRSIPHVQLGSSSQSSHYATALTPITSSPKPHLPYYVDGAAISPPHPPLSPIARCPTLFKDDDHIPQISPPQNKPHDMLKMLLRADGGIPNSLGDCCDCPDESGPGSISDDTMRAQQYKAIQRTEEYVLHTLDILIQLAVYNLDKKRELTTTTLSSSSYSNNSTYVLRRLHERYVVLSHICSELLFPCLSSSHLTGPPQQQMRDVYYRLGAYFTSQEPVNDIIEAICYSLLRVPRYILGLSAAGRGFLGGRVIFNGVDLTQIGCQGMQINGKIAILPTLGGRAIHQNPCHDEISAPSQHYGTVAIHNLFPSQSVPQHSFLHVPPSSPTSSSFAAVYTPNLSVYPGTKYLFIIEKDAIFQRLMQEEIYRLIPCVLITSKGFPCLAVRSLIRYILDMQGMEDERRQYMIDSNGGSGAVASCTAASVHPKSSMKVLALVDYNPSGIHILLQYRNGATHQFNEEVCTSSGIGDTKTNNIPLFAIPEVKWLSMRREDVKAVMAATSKYEPPNLRSCFLPKSIDYSVESRYGSAPVMPFTLRDQQLMVRLSSVAKSMVVPNERHHGDKVTKKKRIKSQYTFPFRWADEILLMEKYPIKVEIEALLSICGHSDSSRSGHGMGSMIAAKAMGGSIMSNDSPSLKGDPNMSLVSSRVSIEAEYLPPQRSTTGVDYQDHLPDGGHESYNLLMSHHPENYQIYNSHGEDTPYIKHDGNYINAGNIGMVPPNMTSSGELLSAQQYEYCNHQRHYEGSCGGRRVEGHRRYSGYPRFSVNRTHDVPNNIRVSWGKRLGMYHTVCGHTSDIPVVPSFTATRLAEALMLPDSTVSGLSMIDASYVCWPDTLLGDIVWRALMDGEVAMEAAGAGILENGNKCSSRLVKYFSSFLPNTSKPVLSPGEEGVLGKKTEGDKCMRDIRQEVIPSFYKIDRVVVFMVNPSHRGVLRTPSPVMPSPSTLSNSENCESNPNATPTPASAHVKYLGTIKLQQIENGGSINEKAQDITHKSKDGDVGDKVRNYDIIDIILDTSRDEAGDRSSVNTSNTNPEKTFKSINILPPVRDAAFHTPIGSLGVTPGAVLLFEAKGGG